MYAYVHSEEMNVNITNLCLLILVVFDACSEANHTFTWSSSGLGIDQCTAGGTWNPVPTITHFFS